MRPGFMALAACAVGCACGAAGRGRGAAEEAAVVAAQAFERARACAYALGRMEDRQAEDVARALPVEPVSLVPVRGTAGLAVTTRAAVQGRLEVARANAGAARAIASLGEGDSVRRTEERAIRAIRAADDLCRAAAALPPRLAGGGQERP